MPPYWKQRPQVYAANTKKRESNTSSGIVVDSAHTKRLTQLYSIGTYIVSVQTLLYNLGRLTSDRVSKSTKSYANENETKKFEKNQSKLLIFGLLYVIEIPLLKTVSLSCVNERTIRFTYIVDTLASTEAERGVCIRLKRGRQSWQIQAVLA